MRHLSVLLTKEVLYRQLFSGNSTLREQALRHVPIGQREQVRELVKIQKDALRLLDILMADLRDAGCEMRKEFNSQYRRRTGIRVVAATVDGIIYSLKQVALASSPLTAVKLTDKDSDFLREKKSTGGKAPLPGFRENFKQTFKLFAAIFGAACPTDFGQDGFAALCDTFELRHRITHPKAFMTFCVQDNETKRASVAIDWLSTELQRLLSASHQSNSLK